ncbi:MAG: hypothetical protein HC789_20660 [Microcoleus sp. CSU_2_2]|nr:hypothetical protein [Microcoleus sp. CSU_2_2]
MQPLISAMTVLAVTIAKPVAERDSKANLLQKAKGFGLLLFLAEATCDRPQA